MLRLPCRRVNEREGQKRTIRWCSDRRACAARWPDNPLDRQARLEHIGRRDQPGDAAVFVNHESNVRTGLPEVLQRLEGWQVLLGGRAADWHG
jgi:hypothetical protein